MPDSDTIVGVSLGGEAVLRCRPYPPDAAARRQVVQLYPAARPINRMEGAARWAGEHWVSTVKAQRWSVISRTPPGAIKRA